MVITYPVGFLVDDAGAILSAPVVTIMNVLTKAGGVVGTPGATVNGSATATPISVDYDAEVKGEAWIILGVTQAGHTITGQNAAPVIYAARDSSRVNVALPPALSLVNAVLDELVSLHTTAGTVGRSLQLARADAKGQWVIVGDVLTLYDVDNATPVAAFNLTPPGGPYTARAATPEAI